MGLMELESKTREILIKIFIASGFITTMILGFLQHWTHFVESGIFFLLLFFLFSHKIRKEESVPDQNVYLKKDEVQNQIDKIAGFIKSVVKHNEVDLTKKLESSQTIFVSIEDYINFLFSSLSEIIEWNISRVEELSLYSAKINYFTNSSKVKSQEQITQAGEIIHLVHHLLDSFHNIVDKSKTAFKITDESSANYSKGREVLDNTVNKVKELDNYIENTNHYLEGVKNFTQEMGKITKMIFDMANKTNVLSLNASIEAVKAGESGKGFKVVAQEIQKFSKVTSDASKKITETLKQMNDEMDKGFKMVRQGKEIVKGVIESTFSLKDTLQVFSENVTQSVNSTRDISEVASRELSQVENINQRINEVQKAISDFKEQFTFLATSAESIIHLTEEITRNVNHFEMDNFQNFAKKQMFAAASKIVGIFEDKVKNQLLNTYDVFDVNYQEILPRSNPKKYHTAYDRLVDQEIQKVLDDLKDSLTQKASLYGKKFLSCAITDNNGYAPIHMKSLSQEISGNYEKDLINSRHKRIYDDPVSLKAAHNDQDFLLQVYMRDMGTQNIDLSIPLRIFDKHWGCLRAGYTFAKLS